MTGSPAAFEGGESPLRLVLCTFPPGPSARRLSLRLVRERLAACASRWPVQSVYLWKGRLESSREETVLFKTSSKKVGALFQRLREMHPYEVPEILELPVTRGHEPYVDWVLRSVNRKGRTSTRSRPVKRPPPRPRRG